MREKSLWNLDGKNDIFFWFLIAELKKSDYNSSIKLTFFNPNAGLNPFANDLRNNDFTQLHVLPASFKDKVA